MSNFLGNIINRHAGSGNTLAPRLRGLFEPRWASSLALPQFPANWQQGGEEEAVNSVNDESTSGEQPKRDGLPSATEQVAGKKTGKKDAPAFFATQDRLEQARNAPVRHRKDEQVRNAPVRLRKDEQIARVHKIATQASSVHLVQNQALERTKVEIPQVEKRTDGLFTGPPNHKVSETSGLYQQEAQVIKPSFTTKTPTPVWQDSIPKLQKEETRTPNTSSRAFSPAAQPFLKELAMQQQYNPDRSGNHLPVGQPTIKVHIGRIEIKAVKEAPIKQARPEATIRRESLEEFLKKQESKLQ